MTKYTDAGLVTDEIDIVAMLMGEMIGKTHDMKLTGLFPSGWQWYDDWARLTLANDYPLTIPWPLVHERLKPIQGKPRFGWNDLHSNSILPWYEIDLGAAFAAENEVAPSALTINKTVGELRELLKWSKGER